MVDPKDKSTESYGKFKEYFATKPAPELAGNLLDRSRTFFNILHNNEYLTKIANNWRFYYGMFNNDYGYTSHKINYTGEQGELTILPVNEFRNIAQHIYVMITASRPAMQARAINTDYKSLSQAYLANGILEYYMREKRLEDSIKMAAEMAIVLGAGFIKMEWDASAGEAYDFDEETGKYNYEGDVEFNVLSPFDVVFDGTKESFKQDWIITRMWKNKYDLMAKYPELADRIDAIPSKQERQVYRLAIWSNDETDDIPVYEFFHKRTESMPNGRYLLFLTEDAVLLDAPLPYRSLPVFRITPGNLMGTPYGYTPMFDIYPLQEALNGVYSTIMTNQNAFGVQSIFIPRGADISFASVEGGMNIIQADGKPEPIQLTATPKEVFEFADMLTSAVERLSGINSVTRGNPEASLKSGTALALVQSMAIQYISGLQQSYIKLIEEVGTALINYLKDFAAAPRVAAIVGKNNKTILKEFSGEDLKAVNRVVVDVGNPLAKTVAGRVGMAEQMMQMGLIKTPQEYFQVINTGSLDVMFEGDQHELLLVKQENEKMMKGESPLVAPTDLHKIHIMEHRTVLADSDLRENQALAQVVMDHIEQHMDKLRETDPALLQLIGEQPLPPPQLAPENVLPPGVPSSGVMKVTDSSKVMAQQQPPQPAEAGMPNIPNPPPPFENLPTNPAEAPVK